MRIYIIRHADPDYENDSITPEGIEEAQALADAMKNVRLTALYTSPMGRARKTASYTVAATGLTPTVLEWTHELSELKYPDTPFGRIAAWDVPGEIYKPLQYGDYDPNTNNGFVPDEKTVESVLGNVAENSDRFLHGFGYTSKGHVYTCDEMTDHDAQIAVFCHNGFGLAWISHLLDIPYRLVWSSFWLAPTSVTTIIMERRRHTTAVPRALHVGDTSHLFHAGIEVKPRGIKENYD